jgi:hypothetical protein
MLQSKFKQLVPFLVLGPVSLVYMITPSAAAVTLAACFTTLFQFILVANILSNSTFSQKSISNESLNVLACHVLKCIRFILPPGVSVKNEEVGPDASRHNGKYLPVLLPARPYGVMEKSLLED